MTWGYRVVKRTTQEVDGPYTSFGIHEVYNIDGSISKTVKPFVYADSVEDLRWMLTKMLESLDKPILDYEE